VSFHGEALLAPRPTPKLEDHTTTTTNTTDDNNNNNNNNNTDVDHFLIKI